MKRTLIASAASAALSLSTVIVFAADQPPAKEASPAVAAPTTGRQLMTHEEKAEHRKKMRTAKTIEEREKLRTNQHEKMKERAKEQGKTIPDTAPMSGMGQGSGMGMGGGMGPRDNSTPK